MSPLDVSICFAQGTGEELHVELIDYVSVIKVGDDAIPNNELVVMFESLEGVSISERSTVEQETSNVIGRVALPMLLVPIEYGRIK